MSDYAVTEAEAEMSARIAALEAQRDELAAALEWAVSVIAETGAYSEWIISGDTYAICKSCKARDYRKKDKVSMNHLPECEWLAAEAALAKVET